MNDDIARTVSTFWDSTSKFSFLNYYYQQRLSETSDEEYVYILECLYEWWEQEQREM